MDDRTFWLLVRRALLMVVSAIEKRWSIGCEEGAEKVYNVVK